MFNKPCFVDCSYVRVESALGLVSSHTQVVSQLLARHVHGERGGASAQDAVEVGQHDERRCAGCRSKLRQP